MGTSRVGRSTVGGSSAVAVDILAESMIDLRILIFNNVDQRTANVGTTVLKSPSSPRFGWARAPHHLLRNVRGDPLPLKHV